MGYEQQENKRGHRIWTQCRIWRFLLLIYAPWNPMDELECWFEKALVTQGETIKCNWRQLPHARLKLKVFLSLTDCSKCTAVRVLQWLFCYYNYDDNFLPQFWPLNLQQAEEKKTKDNSVTWWCLTSIHESWHALFTHITCKTFRTI